MGTTTMIVTVLHCKELKKLHWLKLMGAAPGQKLLVRCSWDVVSGKSKGVEQTVDGVIEEEDLSVERAVFAAIGFVVERNKGVIINKAWIDWSWKEDTLVSVFVGLLIIVLNKNVMQ